MDRATEQPGGVIRVIGLVLMVASVAWIGFIILMTLGIGIAWIGETGWTDELEPWLLMLFLTGSGNW